VRRADARTRRPRPKQLDAPPTLHDLAGGAGIGSGPAVRLRDAALPRVHGAPAGAVTDDAGAIGEVAPAPVVDVAVHAEARAIAARLQLVPPRRARALRSTAGVFAPHRFDGGGDDIDLDRTLERIDSLDDVDDDDVVVRARRQRHRSVVLVVDVSGSMRGERIRMAAATAGALSGRLRDDEVGVIAFWSDAAVLRRLTRRLDARRLIDDLVAIPAGGLTNVAFGLEAAGTMLRDSRGDRRVLMISDCVHNAGPDPAALARGLPRLDVLIDIAGEHDLETARALAHAGRGVAIPVRTHRDVASAVSRCFDAGGATVQPRVR